LCGVVLDPVRRQTLATLEAMVRAYYREDGLTFGEAQAAALTALIEGDTLGCVWLVVQAGAIIGYVVLTLGFSIESGGRDGFIDELYVLPSARDRGAGAKVLALVEQEARRRGVRRLYLEVGHGNRAKTLYRRAGFADHRRHLMSKPL